MLRRHGTQEAEGNDSFGRLVFCVRNQSVLAFCTSLVRGENSCRGPTWAHNGRIILRVNGPVPLTLSDSSALPISWSEARCPSGGHTRGSSAGSVCCAYGPCHLLKSGRLHNSAVVSCLSFWKTVRKLAARSIYTVILASCLHAFSLSIRPRSVLCRGNLL